jgi:hypothetical protein
MSARRAGADRNGVICGASATFQRDVARRSALGRGASVCSAASATVLSAAVSFIDFSDRLGP